MARTYSHSGNQYDFNRNSEWLHDDSQGWGASHADAGNNACCRQFLFISLRFTEKHCVMQAILLFR